MERSVEPLVSAARDRASLSQRFASFVAERQPFALRPALAAFESVCRRDPGRDAEAIDALRAPLGGAIRRELARAPPEGLPETTPGVSVEERLHEARQELREICDGFLRRESIGASFSREERIEMLRGMVMTRAVDNRLKAFFTQGEVRYKDTAF